MIRRPPRATRTDTRFPYTKLFRSEQGFMSPGGRYKPNTILYDLGRAHFLQNYMEMMYELLDLGGRSSLMIPAENQWNNAAFGPWFEKLNNGPKGKARDRIQIGRVIRDLCITDWGGRMFMYENFNGTPDRKSTRLNSS